MREWPLPAELNRARRSCDGDAGICGTDSTSGKENCRFAAGNLGHETVAGSSNWETVWIGMVGTASHIWAMRVTWNPRCRADIVIIVRETAAHTLRAAPGVWDWASVRSSAPFFRGLRGGSLPASRDDDFQVAG